MGLLKAREVMELIGRPEVWIYRAEKDGRFPARLRLGPNSVAWRQDEIEAWLASRPRGPKPSPVLSEQAREGQRQRKLKRRRAAGPA